MKHEQKRLIGLLAALLALCLLLCAAPAILAAENEVIASGEWETCTWKLTADGVLTISGTSMPDLVQEAGQEFQGPPWYENREQIKAVVIEDGITNVGDYAFAFCLNVESVSIPDGVTTIGEGAFWSNQFESISIPDSVTTIRGSAFSHCYMLTSITLPKNLTTIENVAFFNCHSLKIVNFPESLTHIGSVFGQCSLTHITIPSSVTEVDDILGAHLDYAQEILFLGSKPSITNRFSFHETTTIYYPAGDESWESVDEETRKAIGGTWKPYTSYKMVDGAESTWTVDSAESLSFRADGALADCVGLMLDGAPVDPADYKLSEGSTIVKFTADYLKTLTPGEHTLRVLFKDGLAETKFTVKAAETEKPTEPAPSEKPTEPTPTKKPADPAYPDNPKTSDAALLIPAVLMSLCALFLLCLNRKKRVQ